MFFRARTMVGVLIVLGFLLMYAMSCEPVQRHKILTFFFDGVDSQSPPHEPRGDCNLCHKVRRQLQQVRERPGTVWFVHEPWKNRDCKVCHNQLEENQWALPKLTAPEPELCYQCHTDYPATQPYVHGPVAVGECLLCHEAHKSKMAGLLKEKEPELCYQCHETIEAAQISGHPDEPIPQCTKCHDPHAGLTRMLLKK